jgi:hypothetical protein
MPQTTVKHLTTVKPLTSQRTAMPGTSKTVKKNNKSIPTRLPIGSISAKQTVKPVESGIFKLKSNLPGQSRKKPKLLTEMIFRPILDLRTAAMYWKRYVDKKQSEYDKLRTELKNDNARIIENAHRQLTISAIKRYIALNTYEWAIVKRAIFNKKSISLEELNQAISELSNQQIVDYLDVTRDFKQLLDNYEVLVTEYAGEEFTMDSDMRKLKRQIRDLILVNDLGKKQVERLLGVAAAIDDDAMVAAMAVDNAYGKTTMMNAYDKVNCKDDYTAEEIKQHEKIDPIDRLVDICNIPYMANNLNLEAIRTLDINFKNIRDINTYEICILAALKDNLLTTFSNLSSILIECRNKINTDGSLGPRGKYRNFDADAFFKQPNLPFLTIASYCIILTNNPEDLVSRNGYFRIGEPHEVKVSGPEAKEQLLTIYECTKHLLVSNCGWKDNLLNNGITPPNGGQIFSNNKSGKAHRILCPILTNLYNMIHVFRSSKKIEKIAKYDTHYLPAQAPVQAPVQAATQQSLLQRFNPFARRTAAAPVQGLRIQVPMDTPPGPPGGTPPPPPGPPGGTPPPPPPGSPAGSPPAGGAPAGGAPPPAAQPPPAGLALPDKVADLVGLVQTNLRNADILKRAIGHLVTLFNANSGEAVNNLTASVRANAPEILVSALNTITNDHELDNIGCRCLSLISILAYGKIACFLANAQQLLVKVIKRNTANYNDPISHDVITNAITTLKRMVENKPPVFRLKPEHIDALRNAGVKDALMAAKARDPTLNIHELLTILEYDDTGTNQRAAPPRTALGRLAGIFGRGGRRKTVKRKSENKKNSRASRRIMKKNHRVTMRRR